jgi:hypothetical protein
MSGPGPIVAAAGELRRTGTRPGRGTILRLGSLASVTRAEKPASARLGSGPLAKGANPGKGLDSMGVHQVTAAASRTAERKVSCRSAWRWT